MMRAQMDNDNQKDPNNASGALFGGLGKCFLILF